jgi:hypothetical protein
VGRVLLPLLALLLAACSERVTLPPGVMAPEPPRQGSVEPGAFDLHGYRLEPAASYVIDAKVLSKRRYRRDALARIAPWDFALGWGPLSDEPSAALVSVTQGDRLMFWHLLDRRVPQRIVERSTANVHLIPANDAVLQQLDSIVTGAVVRLSGTLVNLYDLASRQRTLRLRRRLRHARPRRAQDRPQAGDDTTRRTGGRRTTATTDRSSSAWPGTAPAPTA